MNTFLYKKIPQTLGDDSKSNHHDNHTQKFCCPNVTRGKLLLLVLFLLLCILLVIYSCYSSLCCAPSDVATNRISIELKEKIRNGKIRAKHTQRRLPQCIIIGVRKGGTRALLEFLNLHSDIQAERSEMHFFDDNEIYANGLDWYRRKMPYSFSHQLTVEKTPAYFTSDEAPERASRMNGSLRLLVILRDPVERAISDYTQIYFNKVEKGKRFEKFEDLAIDAYGRVNKSYKAIRRSVYYKHMERWLHYFPLAQFHFVDGEKLVDDPVPELRKVEDFLGLDHELTRDKFYFNKTRGFYCMRLDSKEKCLAKSKGRPHPPVREVVIHKLRRFFTPLNKRFFTRIGRTFPWPES